MALCSNPKCDLPFEHEPHVVYDLSPDGAALIAAERQRQIEVEGWTPDHDDMHTSGMLAAAGRCYVSAACRQVHGLDAPTYPLPEWPWGREWWKPSDDPIRNLVKAGALIAAEIDRLQRRA